MEIKEFLETNNNENMTTQNYGMQQSSSERQVYSNTILHQETRKTFIDNLTSHLKNWKKNNNNKNPKISRRKEIIKIRGEINEKEMKKK